MFKEGGSTSDCLCNGLKYKILCIPNVIINSFSFEYTFFAASQGPFLNDYESEMTFRGILFSLTVCCFQSNDR